jgi:hypothetical protein
LPAPISELDPDFIDIFFDFATTFTEESVLYAEVKRRKEKETRPTADVFRRLGYSEKEIVGMDIEQ